MIKIDLSGIKNNQQVPKIDFYPIKVDSDTVYLVKKLETGTGDVITDGIYKYELSTKELLRIDSGLHTKAPYNYDMFVPSEQESLQIIRECDFLTYSLVEKDKKDSGYGNVKFYKINLTDSFENIPVFSIKFPIFDYIFDGFKMLSDRYIMVDMANEFDEELWNSSKKFIIDMNRSAITEISDKKMKYSLGISQISPNGKFMIFEEFYMPEEDETLLLTNMDYEIDDDFESSFEGEVNQFKNGINAIALSEFFVENKAGKVNYISLDTMAEDGIIRVICTCPKYIYYKKTKHQTVLKNSKDFNEKVLFGKEEIYRLEKDTLNIEFFTALEIGVELFFCADDAYKVYKDKKSLIVRDLKTGRMIHKYEENCNEDVCGLYEGRYLHLVDRSGDYEKLVDLSCGIEFMSEQIDVFDGMIFYQ